MKNRVKSFSCALINLQALDWQEMGFFFLTDCFGLVKIKLPDLVLVTK